MWDPSLWVDEGFINIPRSEWMTIPLISGWDEKAKGKPKVYPLGLEDQKVVSETFDDLHAKGRMS